MSKYVTDGNLARFLDKLKTVFIAPFATRLETARSIDGVNFNGSSGCFHFGTCSTAAGTNAKVVNCTGFVLAAGARISVKFTKAHTAVATKSTNTVSGNYPTLNVNSTGAKPIVVGGQYAGEGFVNAGETHDFVYDGTNWQDVTATVIYKGSNTNGNYVKHRDGLIEQWGRKTSKTDQVITVTFPLPFSGTNYYPTKNAEISYAQQWDAYNYCFWNLTQTSAKTFFAVNFDWHASGY